MVKLREARYCNYNHLGEPMPQFTRWTEYLWQDYEGCYYDLDLHEYVYPNEE